MTKLLFIVGSLHDHGFNRQLAEKAKALVADRAEVEFLDYADVPFFDQGAEFPTPAPVAAVRKAVAEADGVWIFSPEYNYSYPGVLKNLLDWLSRPVEPAPAESTAVMAGKKVAISSVSGQSAGAGVRAKLTELMNFGKAELLEDQVGVVIPGESWGTGVLTFDADTEQAIAAQVEAFLKFVA